MHGSTDRCKSEAKLTTGFQQPGLLASFILDMTETFIAHQTWNSAGANVGAAICNIASSTHCRVLERW